MRTRRRQRPCRIRHFVQPRLDADLNLRRLTGLRCSPTWIVAVRPPRRQALARVPAGDWRDQ